MPRGFLPFRFGKRRRGRERDVTERRDEAVQSNVSQAPPATGPEGHSGLIATDDLDHVKEPGLHIIFDSVQERSSTSDDQSVSVDVVAIHGLNFRGKTNHARDTWMKDGKLWLRDFLPAHLEKPCRVMLFAYNSSPLISGSAISFDNHASNLLQYLHLRRLETPKRPLVFICHSLGGLIAKEALVQAKLNATYTSILEATRLVVFFATPHQGGNHATLGDLVAKMGSKLLRVPDNDLLQALKQKSDAATKRVDQFRHLTDNFLVVSFFEGQPYGNLGIIVDKRSATLDLPGPREKQVAVDTDHSMICKFDSSNSSICRLVLDTVTTELKQALNASSSVPTNTPPPATRFMIPFCRDPNFVERGDILDQIEGICSQSPHRAAFVGLGGVGKSQLAIEFAYRFAQRAGLQWVFWLHAGTRARAEQGFRRIATLLELPGRDQPEVDLPELVNLWLSNEQNGKWLIILDSADDQDVFFSTTDDTLQPLASYLPQNSHGSVLVTTRDKHLADRLTGHRDKSVEIGPMIAAEATALLKVKLGSHGTWSETVAGELVQALDLVPLAISQAAAYIQSRGPHVSLVSYLKLFRAGERERARLLEHEAVDLRRDGGASNAVLTTWRISFEHIKSKRSSAADLLALISCFDSQGIPLWVLNGEDPPNPNDSSEDASSYVMSATSHDTGEKNEENCAPFDFEFEENLLVLRDYNLVTLNEDGTALEIHSLVQLSTRQWLAASGQQQSFQEQYIDRMYAVFPPGLDHTKWHICRPLLPHAQMALHFQPITEMTEKWARFLYNAAIFADEQNQLSLADNILRNVLGVLQMSGGKHDALEVENKALLGRVLQRQGRYIEAEKLIVDLLKPVNGEPEAIGRSKLAAMRTLFWSLQAQGRLGEAESIAIEATRRCKSELGMKDFETWVTMDHLSWILIKREKLNQAEELHEELSAFCQAQDTELYTQWFDMAMNTRTLLLTKQQRLDEAEILNRQAVENYKTKFGAHHWTTLNHISELAAILYEMGRYAEAGILNVELMETGKEQFGISHPDTIKAMSNLAATLYSLGRYNQAERLQAEVLEVRKVQLGAGHPDTIKAMSNLAATLYSLGRYNQAERLQAEVLKVGKVQLGAGTPDTIKAMRNLAMTLGKLGRHDEAEKLLDEVVATCRENDVVSESKSLYYIGNLALTKDAVGKHKDAVMLTREYIAVSQRIHGPDHEKTASWVARLKDFESKCG